jgi:hypothetical protein
MSGIRTVSFFGPKEGGIGGGRTGADDGRGAAGGFGAGKKFVDEISSEADCGEEGTGAAVSRTGNWIRTVSRGLTLGFGGWRRYRRLRQLDANRLFFWLVRFGHCVKEIDQKSPTCHYPILQLRKM